MGSTAFKAAGTSDPRPAGSIPVHLRQTTAVLAIVMAMKVSEQLPLADVKNRLSDVVDRVEREHQRVVITRYGKPAAVLVSVDDLESLEETLQILSDPSLMADIQLARSEAPTPMSRAEALALIRGQ